MIMIISIITAGPYCVLGTVQRALYELTNLILFNNLWYSIIINPIFANVENGDIKSPSNTTSMRWNWDANCHLLSELMACNFYALNPPPC